MATHFITFADGSDDLRAAGGRLSTQAKETNWFDSCTHWNLNDLRSTSPDWVSKHTPFILGNRRGFGYWIWKSFMIFERLKSIPWNSYLVALDAGYEISSLGKKRFDEYIELAAAYDLLGFEIDEKIGHWTKGDLIEYCGLPLSSILLKDRQIQSGLIIVKKTFHSLMFLSQWTETSVARNYTLIDDSPSSAANPENFIEHRHDQAILTLLARMWNFGYYPISEDYYPELLKDGKFNASYPFQCFRNKTGQRLIPSHHI